MSTRLGGKKGKEIWAEGDRLLETVGAAASVERWASHFMTRERARDPGSLYVSPDPVFQL